MTSHYRTILLAAFAATLSMLVSACAVPAATAPDRSPTPRASISGAPSGAPSQETAVLILVNASNEPIHHVFMSPSSDSMWGTDHLQGELLLRGGALTLSGISPGEWDIRVVDSSGNFKEWYRQQVAPGGQYSLDIDHTGWSAPR